MPECAPSVKNCSFTTEIYQNLHQSVINNDGMWKLGIVEETTTIPQTLEAELNRLLVLKSYDILETEMEPEFEDITKEAAALFNVPIAVVSLVDMGRQWFKSIQGLAAAETPRSCAFCAHVVQRKSTEGVMVVADATKDPRFTENPLVAGGPEIRFYAGAPLKSPEGHVLGSFCIIDMKPHPEGLTTYQKERLQRFADEAVYAMITRLDNWLIDWSIDLISSLGFGLLFYHFFHAY